jgi:predicted dehydrogenase
MKVLQIGVGARGRTWARILRDLGAETVAFVDPAPEAAAWARTDFPLVPCFSHHRDALAAVSADVAVVVTPPMGRAGVLLPLFVAGLDVISEKPLETNLAEAVRIVRAAERAGRQLSVCLNFRYLPVTQRLKEILATAWGQITHATFLYHINRDGYRPGLNRFPLVMDDPMLLEQSIHHIDLLRFAYGAEITGVRAETFNPRGSMYRRDATVSALFEMDRGIRVTYIGSWVTGSNIRAFEWRTDCTRGVAVQRALFDGLETGPVDGPLDPVAVEPVEPFVTDTRRYAEAALAALAARRPVPCSGRDHLMSLAATVACRRSAQTGRVVAPAGLLAEASLPSEDVAVPGGQDSAPPC